MPNILFQILFQIPDVSKPVKDAADSWFDSPPKLIENSASPNMFYSTSENLLSLSKEEFLQNKILFLTECHPLHHRGLMHATPFKVLCPRRGPQVCPAAWTTLAAHVLSACLCAMSMVYLPDLRLISTQESAPPWLLYVTEFRDKQEIATAKEDFSWCPTVQ